ncbi:MAG: right-handed parallel beta-helix repeat-containing protein, partial [Opitutales bacterium]|nr:right-handed parallel beta-helix repeat-containing protein [Opitutales bacterium]
THPRPPQGDPLMAVAQSSRAASAPDPRGCRPTGRADPAPRALSLYPRFLALSACLLAMAAGQFAQATWLEQDTFESYPAGAPLRRALDIFNHANANNDGLDLSESYAAGAAPELPWSLSDSGIMGEVAFHGTVIYVNHAAAGANNGTSWADAFISLRDALAAAQAGQEIWVAAGTYSPFVSNRATDSFLLVSEISVYGGFVGTETERSERDWLANETILSGLRAGEANMRHIVNATGAVDARLDGLTIRDGHSDGSDPYSDGVGAAVFVGLGDGRLTLANCRIVGNLANWGGVVYFDANANDPKLRIENTVFADNSIGEQWARGVLQIRSNAAHVRIESSLLQNNSSGLFSEAMELQVLRTHFYRHDGIAVDINYHGARNDFVNCVFDQNGGGAIRMVNSQQLRVANCVFTGNTNPMEYGSGAALNISQGRFEVHNSTFFNNNADEGAAIAWSYGWAGNETSLIHNSIFWGNTGKNVILLERYADDLMTLELRNNLLQGGAANVATWADPVVMIENLLDTDPLFVDVNNVTGPDGLWATADDGLRLQASSPAANGGLAGLLPSDWLDLNANGNLSESLPSDLLGAARVQDDHPCLGAYETLAQGQPAPDAYADWAAANNISGGPTDETGGVANLIRYALGGDATTPMGTLLPQFDLQPTADGLNLSLTFHRIDDPLVTYAVWFSEDLSNWGSGPIWQGTGAHEDEPGAFAVGVTVPTPGDRSFLRLEVTRPE